MIGLELSQPVFRRGLAPSRSGSPAEAAGRWIHLDAAFPGLSRGLYLKLAAVSQLDAAGTGTVLATVFDKLLGESIETLPARRERAP